MTNTGKGIREDFSCTGAGKDDHCRDSTLCLFSCLFRLQQRFIRLLSSPQETSWKCPKGALEIPQTRPQMFSFTGGCTNTAMQGWGASRGSHRQSHHKYGKMPAASCEAHSNVLDLTPHLHTCTHILITISYVSEHIHHGSHWGRKALRCGLPESTCRKERAREGWRVFQITVRWGKSNMDRVLQHIIVFISSLV